MKPEQPVSRTTRKRDERFAQFCGGMKQHFDKMAESHRNIFLVECAPGELYEQYLDSFPEGENPMFRERRKYDCGSCRSFVEKLGGAVFIDDDFTVHTMWEFETDDPVFGTVARHMDAFVRARPVSDVFFSDALTIGHTQNNDGELHMTWDHFMVEIPRRFHAFYSPWDSRERYRDSAALLDLAYNKISMDAVDAVRKLVEDRAIFKWAKPHRYGWLSALKRRKAAYDALEENQKALYIWLHAEDDGLFIGRAFSGSMDKLLTDITQGRDPKEAALAYKQARRPKKRIEAMLWDAKRAIREYGYSKSLPRRFATLDDIRAGDLLFSDRNAGSGSAARLLTGAWLQLKNRNASDGIEEIPVERFVRGVLPTARRLDAYVENRHAPSFVSLITSVDPNAPSMFQWDNAFSWAYNDMDIKKTVRTVGRRADGVLRFSVVSRNVDVMCQTPGSLIRSKGKSRIPWNCFEEEAFPDGGSYEIYCFRSNFYLENITWADKGRMLPGTYVFRAEACETDFRAEIELAGQIFHYDWNKELNSGGTIEIAVVTLDQNGRFTIEHKLPLGTSSSMIWDVRTKAFAPVSAVMYSPNRWAGESGVGPRHIFFMLAGCKNRQKPHGFNEFLKPELLKHLPALENERAVEKLGRSIQVPYADDQLSGIGFDTAKRDSLIVRVDGTAGRVMKVLF